MVAPLEALGVTVTVEVIGTVPAIEALNPGMGVPVPEVGVRPTFVLMLQAYVAAGIFEVSGSGGIATPLQ